MNEQMSYRRVQFDLRRKIQQYHKLYVKIFQDFTEQRNKTLFYVKFLSFWHFEFCSIQFNNSSKVSATYQKPCHEFKPRTRPDILGILTPTRLFAKLELLHARDTSPFAMLISRKLPESTYYTKVCIE